MPVKIFVGRLSDGTSSDEIRGLFKKFGTVTECDVLGNFGFVHMESDDEAKSAISALDGYSVNGSHIHVEMSTANTQGRKRRGENFRGNGRMGDQYSSLRDVPHRGPLPAGPPPDRYPPAREEFASDQVKDLLELYFRDPQAFDQYAKTYYYGERMERARAYYDRRPEPAAYASSVIRREDELVRGGPAVYGRPVYATSSAAVSAVDPVYAARAAGLSLRDDVRGPYSAPAPYGTGRM